MAPAWWFVLVLPTSALLCFTPTLVRTDDDHDARVVTYTADTFSNGLAEKRNFVMFYAPWCGHCKRLGPTWDELAKKYNKNPESQVTVAKVDCTAETALCADQDISGYPTLKYFAEDGTDFVRYRGSRDLASLSDFVESQLAEEAGKPAGVAEEEEVAAPVPVELDDATFTEHTKFGQHFVKFYAPWCTHCKQMAPAWEQLAAAFAQNDAVSVAQVDCTTQRTTCDMQDVQGYPTLIWLQDGQKVEQYTGGRSLEELRQYVERMLGRPTPAQSNDGAIPAHVASPEDSVVVLTEEDFDAVVGETMVFVKFFAPWCGHCKRLAPTWEDLARKFAGTPDVKVAEVDCTKQGELCQRHQIRGYPTLLLFRNGIQLGEFSGQRTLEGLQNFVKDHLGMHEEL